MNNENNVVTEDKTKVKVNKMPLSKKNKLILFVGLGIIAIFIIILIISSFKTKNNSLPNGVNENGEMVIDSSYDWANKYGASLYDTFKESDKLEIAFVNVNTTTEPEMIIKYNDEQDRLVWQIYSIDKDDVKKTRKFFNADFYLITPITNKNISWYMYIGSKNYGTYTIMSQLVDGTALDSSIKATNDTEVGKYLKEYLHSNYKLVFYEVEISNFKDDFLKKVDKYTEDNENAQKEIDKLSDQYDEYVLEHGNGEEIPIIKLAAFTLQAGTYEGKLYKSVDGNTTFELVYVQIIDYNTLKYNNKELKFTVEGNDLKCDDDVTINVNGNNKFDITDENGVNVSYELKVEEEKEEETPLDTN